METVQQDTFAMKELLDEGRDRLTGLARALLEAGVNEMMAAQADAICEATGSARNGFRERHFETQVGTITLRIPKLRRGTYFPDGAVERWSRIDRAVICAVAEMYALGVSTRKVGCVLERMGADRLSKDAVSRICAAPGAEVAELRTRQLPGIRFLHLWVDATYVPCHRNDHGATAAVVAATAVGGNGLKRVVDLSCVDAESYASWKGFLRGLRERGPSGVRCVTSDAHGGIVRAVREMFPGAAWQRCAVHLERDVIDACPKRAKRAAAGRVLHAVFDEGDPGKARALYRTACGVIASLSPDAGRIMEGGRGGRPRLPRLPRGAPPPHQDEQHAGAHEPGGQAPRARRPELPVGRGADPADRRRLLRGVRGLVQRRYMDQSAIEGLWEGRQRLRPTPRTSWPRGRERVVALSGFDEGGRWRRRFSSSKIPGGSPYTTFCDTTLSNGERWWDSIFARREGPRALPASVHATLLHLEIQPTASVLCTRSTQSPTLH